MTRRAIESLPEFIPTERNMTARHSVPDLDKETERAMKAAFEAVGTFAACSHLVSEEEVDRQINALRSRIRDVDATGRKLERERCARIADHVAGEFPTSIEAARTTVSSVGAGEAIGSRSAAERIAAAIRRNETPELTVEALPK